MKNTAEKLTDKEEETMLLLWEHGPCAVKDLVKQYSDPQPHINTVSSFVRSLEKKGYVGHEQGRYGGFNYFAIRPIGDYRKNAVGKFVRQFFGSSFSLVSQLVEDRQIGANELRQLLDMIENKKYDE